MNTNIRTAIDELKFNLKWSEKMAESKPSSKLTDSKRAFGSHMVAAQYCSAGMIRKSLRLDGWKESLSNSIKWSNRAYEIYPQFELWMLTHNIYKHILLGDYEKVIAHIEMIRAVEDDPSQAKNSNSWFLYMLLSYAVYGESPQNYRDELTKIERRKRRHPLIHNGSLEVIDALTHDDSESLALAMNKFLLTHHKHANDARSYEVKSTSALFSELPIVATAIAKIKGLDVTNLLSENVNLLKLTLSSPADFPELPKNYRMPIKVDYLTGEVFIQ